MTWQYEKLGNVSDMLVGFSFKSKDFIDASGEGIKLVRGDNVQQGFIRWGDKAKKWREDEYECLSRFQLQKDDVILAMDRPIVGGGLKLAWIKEQDIPSLLVQRVTRIRGICGVALTNFLRYTLSSPDFIAHIEKITTGANIPHISGKDIANFEFRLPSISEQENIIEIILAYDDLIETNQRRITLLEESARLLYREWFVNLRFPGCKLVEMIDQIPKGWSRKSLAEIASIEMGQSPESKYYNTENNGLPFHQGVSDFDHRFINHRIFTTQASRTALAGDILCSVRAPVGRLNITHDNIAIGRGLSAMRSKTGRQSMLFYQLSNLFFKEDLIGGGAIFAAVGKNELLSQEVLEPDDEIASAFENIVSVIDEQIKILTFQCRSLQIARDELLPKIMSGEIQV